MVTSNAHPTPTQSKRKSRGAAAIHERDLTRGARAGSRSWHKIGHRGGPSLEQHPMRHKTERGSSFTVETAPTRNRHTSVEPARAPARLTPCRASDGELCIPNLVRHVLATEIVTSRRRGGCRDRNRDPDGGPMSSSSSSTRSTLWRLEARWRPSRPTKAPRGEILDLWLPISMVIVHRNRPCRSVRSMKTRR